MNSVVGSHRPVVVAGVVLGIGQAGFFDGIVFHQLLQWHHMFSSVKTDATLAGMELNTIGDGLFHAFDWLMTLLGIFLLWRAGKRQDVIWSTSAFVGSLLIGGGLFNVVEGLLDHQILGIHHVKPGPNVVAYDIGFLTIGALMVVVGWVLLLGARQGQRKT
ncbi:MAG: DUF2243 domain-containing protein [Chroococcidiopsidaceae cyanobacterium CP_BM_RX_35]|nr:DUF2243 domain-containing protein [Chroococcidiopsidaceae cyanobacterium CP_BM_RX_35]